MTKLIYLTDVNQVQYVLDNDPLYFEQRLPITGELVVAYELKRLNIEFINEWDFLSSHEIESNDTKARELLDNWYDKSLTPLEFMGIDLSCMAKEDLAYTFLCCLNSKTVFEKIFGNYNIESIDGFFLEFVPIVRNGPAPANRAVRSITQAVFFFMAEKFGISINKLTSSPILSSINRQSIKISNWDRLIKFLKRKNFTKSIANTRATKMAFIFYDVMPSYEHEAIIKLFNGFDDWCLISISKSDLIKNSNSEIKDYLIKSKSLSNFLLAKNDKSELIPEIFNNQFLEFQFSRIWDEMNLAVCYGESYLDLISLAKPDLVIFGYDSFTTDRLLVNLSKINNIPTLALLHGGLGPKIGFRGIVGDSDLTAVWNDRDIACLESYGVESEKIVKLGSLRYEEKFKEYKINQQSSYYDSKLFKKYKLDSKKPVILILTTAINVGLSLPAAIPTTHLINLDELLEIVRRRTDLQFVIKPHPGYDYYELYRRLDSLDLNNLVIHENADFNEVIKLSNVTVLFNYFTTAALESMLNRIPVVYLNSAVYQSDGFGIMLDEFKLNVVRSLADLESKIDLLLKEKKYLNRTLEESDGLIKSLLSIGNLSYNERLEELITSLLSLNKQYVISSSDKRGVISQSFFGINISSLSINQVQSLAFLFGATGLSLCNSSISKSQYYKKHKNHIIKSYFSGNRFCVKTQFELIPYLLLDLIKNRRNSILYLRFW